MRNWRVADAADAGGWMIGGLVGGLIPNTNSFLEIAATPFPNVSNEVDKPCGVLTPERCLWSTNIGFTRNLGATSVLKAEVWELSHGCGQI
ncbi:hypothetical protein VNO77_04856 [Canavalia gladiata]|uniref:Uncharacterized protein n=1 Tax=Canavalia gladiata TaxID=3824 RepID=A0AAN9R546_CANGL